MMIFTKLFDIVELESFPPGLNNLPKDKAKGIPLRGRGTIITEGELN